MAKSKELKKLEKDERMLNKLATRLLNCNSRLFQIGNGEIERDEDDYNCDNIRYRYEVYNAPHVNNFIVVEEAILFRGVDCESVLKSVAYDLLKMDDDETTYRHLINALEFCKDSFIYLQKTYEIDSWSDNNGVHIGYVIIENIPDINERLSRKEALQHLPSLLLYDNPDKLTLAARLDGFFGGNKDKSPDKAAVTNGASKPTSDPASDDATKAITDSRNTEDEPA